MKQKLIVVLGPTAVGKTQFAVKLAAKFNGEIISADSRQVYRGMDIGTGKDLQDYKIDGKRIPNHLIDIIDPSEEFDLYNFQKLFYKAFIDIYGRNKLPILVGGTGLYIHSILKKYNLSKTDFYSQRRNDLDTLSKEELIGILQSQKSKLHNTTDLIDRGRIIKAILIEEQKSNSLKKPQIDFDYLVLGVKDDREQIKMGISKRLKTRLADGMIKEVQGLLENGITLDKLEYFGLEYKFICKHIRGELSYNDMFQKLNSAIHKFAKRQMTWFRKMEREGVEINWMKKTEHERSIDLIKNFLADAKING